MRKIGVTEGVFSTQQMFRHIRRRAMGPFPHNAPKSEITPENPAGTDGFEFVEFAHPEPQVLRDLFARMGFDMVARHKDSPGSSCGSRAMSPIS